MSFKHFRHGPKIQIQTSASKSSLNMQAANWIKKLHLKRHPEGGYFLETYRAEPKLNLPGSNASRNISSAIYYLLDGTQVSLFHRIKSDEIWHHYDGATLSLYVIKDGKLVKISLGKKGTAVPQVLIKGGCWIAASIRSGGYCLVGCTVSPGFDYRDWELGTRRELLALIPQHASLVQKYTTV